VSLVELRQLRDRVGELSAVLKGREVELGELQKSLSVAIDSRNEQVAVQAVTQTRDRMESIKKTISDVDEAGKKAVSIADTAAGLATGLLKLVEFVRPLL